MHFVINFMLSRLFELDLLDLLTLPAKFLVSHGYNWHMVKYLIDGKDRKIEK